jgi:uncharacterized protein
MERVTLAEAELIARQIGRAPRGEYSIVQRCPHGFPRVLRVPPLVDGAPFPTLYWLSCPFLCRAVSDLEAAGWVSRLERRVAEEPELRAALERAHDAYIAERRRFLSAGAEEVLAESGRLRLLDERGIGGIADRTRLKCLHLHVAHAVVGENPIGSVVLGMLTLTACPGEKAICSSLAGERSRSQINR